MRSDKYTKIGKEITGRREKKDEMERKAKIKKIQR